MTPAYIDGRESALAPFPDMYLLPARVHVREVFFNSAKDRRQITTRPLWYNTFDV